MLLPDQVIDDAQRRAEVLPARASTVLRQRRSRLQDQVRFGYEVFQGVEFGSAGWHTLTVGRIWDDCKR